MSELEEETRVLRKQQLATERSESACRLYELKADLSHWYERRNTLTESLARAEEAIKNLTGVFMRGRGGIQVLEASLKQLDLEIADLNLPMVVWASNAPLIEDHVVAKVTAKRIYVRKVGNTCCDLFHTGGRAVSAHDRRTIDIQATFPKVLPQ